MRCHHVQKRLAVYQDGEMGGKERERIAAHLEGCPACRSAYAELEQTWQVLEKIPEIEASPGFEGRLFGRIDVLPEPRAWWRFPRLSWLYRAYPAPALAAVVLLLGVVMGGYLGGALVSDFSPAPAPVQAVSAVTDSVSFQVFSATPPGTLGDSYLRLAHFTEEDRK